MTETPLNPPDSQLRTPDVSDRRIGRLQALLAATLMTVLGGCAHVDKAWLAKNVFTAYAEQYPDEAETAAVIADLEAEIGKIEDAQADTKTEFHLEPIPEVKTYSIKEVEEIAHSLFADLPEAERIEKICVSFGLPSERNYYGYKMDLNIFVSLDNGERLDLKIPVTAQDLPFEEFHFSILNPDFMDNYAVSTAVGKLKENAGYFRFRLSSQFYDGHGNPLPEVQ